VFAGLFVEGVVARTLPTAAAAELSEAHWQRLLITFADGVALGGKMRGGLAEFVVRS
jgi:hypothetical protein